MSVETAAVWIEPWTVLVPNELATTPVVVCCDGTACDTRSAKPVFFSLNPVVCELATLPEIFCSANDCACRPATAVVNASKIPMTDLQLKLRSRRDPRRPSANSVPAGPEQAPCHGNYAVILMAYAHRPVTRPARICRLAAEIAGLNVLSFPAKRGRGTILRSKMVEGAPDSTLHSRPRRFVESRPPLPPRPARAVPLPRFATLHGEDDQVTPPRLGARLATRHRAA